MVITTIGGDGALQNTASHQTDHLTDILSPQVKECWLDQGYCASIQSRFLYLWRLEISEMVYLMWSGILMCPIPSNRGYNHRSAQLFKSLQIWKLSWSYSEFLFANEWGKQAMEYTVVDFFRKRFDMVREKVLSIKLQNLPCINIYSPSLVVLYRWLVEFLEDVHKTKKLGINGHNNISKGHQLPM